MNSPETSTTTPNDPVAVVQQFLSAMQDRDLTVARQCLHSDFTMTFPGNARFTRLEELMEWAAPRYQAIGKVIDRCELVNTSAIPVVWCFGTLQGQWPDGQPFDGIRFVDRFTLRSGLLVDQMVWNDLAEIARLRT